MGKRIALLDALRGFALLGILLTHFNHWFVVGLLPAGVLQPSYGTLSNVCELIIHNFISYKFFLLFSFIFGFSFYLQTVSFKKITSNIDLVFFRRAIFLFVIGTVHYVFWNGDILTSYAVLIIPLLLLRRLNDTLLFVTGLLLLLNVPGMALKAYQLLHTAPALITSTAPTDTAANSLYYVVSQGGIKDMVNYDLHHIGGLIEYQVLSGSFSKILGCFLLGMFTARKGWFQMIEENKKMVYRIAVFSFILLVAIQVIQGRHHSQDNNADMGMYALNSFILFCKDLLSIAMYVCVISVLFFHKATVGLANSFATIGKMALSIYLLQTVVGIILFYHVGFGLFGKTTPAMNFLIALVVYTLQVFFARVWYRYFNYGIVEWLLRAGTLMEFKDLRKTDQK